MKKLKRPSTPPSCLSGFRHGRDKWGCLSRVDKYNANVWEKLYEMQKGFCAYCECSINVNRRIEHFRRRADFPKLTFDWSNLFGSCDNRNRCDIHKDAPKTGSYNSENLIKPDVENPSDYLIFLITGKVRPKSKLTSTNKYKAEETIRVFNLDSDPALVNSRRVILKYEIVNILELYEAIDDLKESDWDELLHDELGKLTGREYQTALEHAWKYNQDY